MTVSNSCSYNHIIKGWKEPLKVIGSAPTLKGANFKLHNSRQQKSPLASLLKAEQMQFSELHPTHYMLQPPLILVPSLKFYSLEQKQEENKQKINLELSLFRRCKLGGAAFCIT